MSLCSRVPKTKRPEPSVAGLECVRIGVRRVNDAVACADRMLLLTLPRPARSGEHEDDLLFATVDVDRDGQPPRIDVHQAQTDADGTCRSSEIGPPSGRGR